MEMSQLKSIVYRSVRVLALVHIVQYSTDTRVRGTPKYAGSKKLYSTRTLYTHTYTNVCTFVYYGITV